MTTYRFLIDNAPFLTAGALLTFLSSLGQTFFISIFSGEIRAGFGLSHGDWGALYMLGTMASAVAMVWAGGLTDVIRVRRLGPVVLVGLALAALAMAFNTWAAALPVVVFALRFFGQGMASHIAVVAMTRWFARARGRALAIASLGFAFGEAMLPIAFAALLTVLDWRLLWVGAAAGALVGAAVLARLLRHERQPGAGAAQGSAVGAGMAGRHWTRRAALGDRVFWLMLPAVMGPAAFNTAFFFHQVHFAEIKGVSHVGLVALFPLYTGVAIAAMLVAGWTLDRLGARRLIGVSQLPMAAGFVLLAQATGPGTILAGLVLVALTSGANATLPNAFWAESYGTDHIGAIKALAAAGMVLGSAIGPGLTGVLIDLGIGLETQFIGVAAYFLGATALMLMATARVRRALA